VGGGVWGDCVGAGGGDWGGGGVVWVGGGGGGRLTRCVCSINVFYGYPAKLTAEDDKEIIVWCPAYGVTYTYRYLGCCGQYKFWAGSLSHKANCSTP